ncbi:MAG: hypothetical protein GY699_10405 [Desulfobacteraceae bacterium]|nr:hypothetical protein [Desulfobacteraceae bacterium]
MQASHPDIKPKIARHPLCNSDPTTPPAYKKIYFVAFFFFGIFFAGISLAEEVSKIKTFESDTLTEYTIAYLYKSAKYHLHYSNNKTDQLVGIKYNPAHRFAAFKDLQPILTKLVEQADRINNVKLSYLTTFEFLGCDDIFIKSFLAFRKETEWQNYLIESKKRYVRPPYDFVKKQLTNKGVFSELGRLFLSLGYEMTFSSFEKLAVRKAKDFNFYSDLKQYGILPDDKFPVPLILYFSFYKE